MENLIISLYVGTNSYQEDPTNFIDFLVAEIIAAISTTKVHFLAVVDGCAPKLN